MMKSVFTLLTALVFISGAALSQVAQGPFPGSIPGGVSVTTDNFGPDSPPADPGDFVHNRFIVPPSPPPPGMPAPTGPEGSNYFEDPSIQGLDGPPPITLGSFVGLGQAQGAGFPPDPYVAAGPDHIIQVINTTFRITTKSGTTLKTISFPSWFATTISNVNYTDPKVQYDHLAGRWVLTILTYNTSTQVSYDMVSVSDDNNPIGTWYNWAVPSHLVGSSNSGTFGDYPGLGYDNEAIYITSNHFTFAGFYQFAKIRIIPKAQLYANTAGAVAWNDFSSVVHLSSGTSAIGVRPAVVYGLPPAYYLIAIPNFTSGSSVTLYRITNPVTSPSISAVTVSVNSWTAPPSTVGQLGGGSPALDGGGSNGFIRFEPTYRDSSIWFVHSANNGGYSSLRYVRISTLTNTAVEDIAFGAQGYWYIYPAIKVDKDKNLVITATRTGETEYAGAAFTWRLSGDLPGLRPTTVFAPGLGNYVVNAGGRNRWGDYMGIALDPADQNNFWMFTEYAANTNTFGNWVHGIRVVPYAGRRVLLDRTSIDFGRIEVGSVSDTVAVTVYNIGASTLTVSSITRTQSQYSLLNLPSFPANLGSFDSLQFRVAFTPASHALVIDSITIASNDSLNPLTRIPLNGKGVIIGRAQPGVMYAVSGPPAVGQLYNINTGTGTATAVGPTGVAELDGLAIRPSNQVLYGISTNVTGSTLYRMSSQYGDALMSRTLGIPNMRAIAFSPGDTLFAATTNGRVYRINVNTGDTTYIGTAAGKTFSGLSFSPTSGKLWASVRPPITGRDSIYTVNTQTGATTTIGRTLLNLITPSIAFNPNGTLYALIGSGAQTNSLYTLDTLTANATLVGSTGTTALYAIAMRPDSLVTGVEDQEGTVPKVYTLQQNYPNPFNPSTTIAFQLPVSGHVSMKVFDLLGREVRTLVDGRREAGYHSIVFDATGLGSGVYYYQMVAGSFNQTKKLLLLR